MNPVVEFFIIGDVHFLQSIHTAKLRMLCPKICPTQKNSINTITDNGIGRQRSAELKTANQLSHRSTGMETTRQRLELINDHPPTKTEKILSVLPFIFPLLDSVVYGRFLLEPIGDNSLVTGLAAIYAVYRSIPLSSFISVYTLNRLSEIPSINRQVRFNMQQGVYLEFALVIPGVLSVLSHLASTKLGVSLPITIQELGSDAVFLGTMAAIAYSTASSLLGKTPDIPIFSAEINKRVPSMAEFLDSDGSIDPAKIEKKILEMEKETAEKNE